MRFIYSITRITLVMLFACGMLNAQEVVADYPFSGSAADVSTYGNHAAINGALLTQDRFGAARSAFQFDGSTAFLGAENAAQLLTDNVTISMWVNVSELPGQGEAYLVSFGGWQERYKISLPSHGKVIWTTNADGISDMDAGDGNELQEGVWTHVAVSHDGTQDKIYINGALTASKDVAGPLNMTDAPLGFGYNIYEGGSYFNGALDDISIFDSALSDQEIANLYAAQSMEPVFADGLVANYGFNGSYQDSSEFGIQAKGNGSRLTTDRHGFGNSAAQVGGEASIDVPNSNHLNSGATSIAFWVNVSELPGTGEVYIASHGGWQERWKVSLPSHGKPVFTTNHENGISDMDSGDGNELVAGEWTHCTFVHDGATDKIYMNGALVAEKDVAGLLNSTQYPLALGFDPIGGGNYMTGQFDEFRVYNYALTDQDIADLYAAQSSANIEDDALVANFTFSGDGQDDSQFGNDAMVSGATPGVDRFGYGANAMAFGEEQVAYAMNSVQYQSEVTSIAFWVNVKNLPGTGEVFLASHGGWQQRWKISLPSHGKPVFTTNHENGISDMDSGDGNELVEGEWTHCVFVHDGAQDIIYMNGARVAQKDVAGNLNKTDYPFGFGFNPVDGGNYLDGMLDEVRLYNVALTDQEVADLYADQNTDPAPADELVANYTFSGNALDETPFSNHGGVNGAVLAGDRFDRTSQAFRFDGVSSNIAASNSKQLQSPTTSIAFWVNVGQLPGSGENFILSHGGWQQRWKVSLPSHGKPVFTTNHTNGISDMDSGDGNELVPGEWTHVVMVHDGAKNIIYFDGAQVAEKDVVGDLNETEYDFGIGYNPIDNANYFDGMLDEVRLYNVALTAQQVSDLYDEQSTPPTGGDTEAPTAPVDLIGTVVNTEVGLSWCESTDNEAVAGYNIYQDSMIIAQSQSTSFDVPGLAQLTDYEFGVSAYDFAGNASLVTRIQVTTGVDATPDTIPPSAPSNLAASIGSNSIVLSWDASTDNQAVAGYIVFLDGVIVDTTGPAELSLFIGGLEPETPYYIEVQAFDLAGNNSEFGELEVTTDPPVDAGEEGLVAHYPFEGNADDATPYENHGAIGGDPIFEAVADRPDASGMAIVFDGDRDSVLAPNAPQLISDYTTVSFWIRVDGQNLEDPEAYVMDFGHWDQRWKISLPQHLKIVWTTNSETVQFPNSVSDMDSGDGNEVVAGFWWYVTMVHDGDDDIIYIDGEEVNRKPAPGTLNSTARALVMGNDPIGGGLYFNGALDEVKIYNKALTADEILKLYETGTTSIGYISPELSKYVDVLYPNPTTDRIVLEHNFDTPQTLWVRIFDQSGRQVDMQKIDNVQLGTGQLSWDVSNYAPGYYTLNFVLGGKNLGGLPFIKQ